MPTAALFPGQGSHAPGMDEPFRGHPVLERGVELLGFDPFAPELLGQGTRYQQPAILLVSVAAWEERSDRTPPVAAAGHSLGEYAALVAARALGLEDAVRVVAERAAAMDEAGRASPGAMAAFLGGDDAAVRALAARLGLVVANDNAPGQLVLSGAADAVAEAVACGKDETGARPVPLDVSGAFHSPLMASAASRLEAALASVRFTDPAFPVYSNDTVEPFRQPARQLVENLSRPVRWRETMLALRDGAGADTFAEYGPGRVLTGLVKRTVGRAAVRS